MAADDKDQFLKDAFGFTGVSISGGASGGEQSAAAAGDAAPTISVTAKGDGSFTVQGSGFLPGKPVRIQITDDALKQINFETSAGSDGRISLPTGKICQLPGNLHFQATDGRANPDDLTGVLWSNNVTQPCPPDSGSDGGDGSDGSDGSDGGSDGGGGGGGGGSDGGGGGGSDGGGGGGSDGGGGGSDGGGSDGSDGSDGS